MTACPFFVFRISNFCQMFLTLALLSEWYSNFKATSDYFFLFFIFSNFNKLKIKRYII
jgi:hypothetical protein